MSEPLYRIAPSGERVPLSAAQIEQLAAAQVPAPEPLPVEISDRQFGEGLWTDELISYEEYLAFVGPGEIPPPLQAILDQLPDDDTGAPTPRKRAIGLVKGATSYRLDNPLVDVVRAARGWTQAELHERWRVWGTL